MVNKLILSAAIVIAAAGCEVGCGGAVVVTSVIDCTARNRDDIAKLVDQAVLAIDGGASWGDVEETAWQAGRDIGGCVLAELVDVYTSRAARPAASVSGAVDVTLARSALLDFKRQSGSEHVVFHTGHGDH